MVTPTPGARPDRPGGGAPDAAPATSGHRTADTVRTFTTGAGLVAGGTLLASALLFAVSLLASRALGPEEYGVVAAMLSLVVVLTIPSYSIQTITAQEVGEIRGRGGTAEEIAAVMRRRLMDALVIGGVATVLVVAIAPVLENLLSLADPWPVVLTAASALPLLVVTMARGVMQGTGRYGQFAASLVLDGAVRLIAAAVAVVLGLGATGVTASPAIASAVAAIAGLVVLRRLWAALPSSRRTRSVAQIGATAAFFAGFAALTNVDMLIVKHAADAASAGEYAGAAFYGKIVLLVPIAVGMVLVPETAARRAAGRATGAVLRWAILLVSGFCAVLVAAGYLAPRLVQLATVGDEYSGVRDLLGPYAVATSCMSLLSLVALYGVTVGRPRIAWLVLAAAPVQAATMIAVRDSSMAVIWTMAAVAAALTAFGVVDLLLARRRGDVMVPAGP